MPYRLLGPDGDPYLSETPGTLGGHRRSKIYGRLDCPAALRAIARGGPYAAHRVFFASEADAVSAGYRPCARCLPDAYAAWRISLAERDTSATQAGPTRSPPRSSAG